MSEKDVPTITITVKLTPVCPLRGVPYPDPRRWMYGAMALWSMVHITMCFLLHGPIFLAWLLVYAVGTWFIASGVVKLVWARWRKKHPVRAEGGLTGEARERLAEQYASAPWN